MKKIILIILFIGIVQLMKAQEWETQTYVTGYVALNGEYIHNLLVFEKVKGNDYGMNIGEASILASIKPLEKLKINSVVTYKPRLHFDEIITEISGEWTFSDKFKAKVGRFLLPLHPANTQYYAPMNVGVALPIFVTNHALFPLNLNGLNLNGRFPFNDNFSLYYNLSAGQYAKMSRVEAGILGFFGRDGVYLNENVQQVTGMIDKIESKEDGHYPQFFGGGGKTCIEIGTVLKFGFAGFYTDEETSTQLDPTDPTTVVKTNVEMFNYGVNLILKLDNFNAMGSAWFGNETPDDKQNFDSYNIELYYGELSYTIGQVTPYTKVEVVNGRMKDWTRGTFGLNYRPHFETTFKLEFHRYFQEYVDDFNVFQFSAIYSF